jgi:hypothetical protein
MKKIKIITGVVAMAALCGMNAMAQINYQNGDMLAGFRISGGSSELIVDLGSIANFQQPHTPSFGFAGVSAALTSYFGSDLSGVDWSVFGVNDTTIAPNNSSVSQANPYTIWSTLPRFNPNAQTIDPLVGGNSASQQLVASDIETIASLTNPNQVGPGLIVNVSPNIVAVSASLGGYSSEMSSPNNGNFQGDWSYNIENLGARVSDLYQSNPGNPYTARASYLGNFVLDVSGNLTFNPVPEPSTWAMIGGGLTCLMAFRRPKKA